MRPAESPDAPSTPVAAQPEAALGAPPATPPDASSADAAPRSLDPKVRLLWTIAGVATWVVLGVAGSVALGVSGRGDWAPLAAGAAVFLSVLTALWARLEWSRWSWLPDEEVIELRHGVIRRCESVVPYRRMQQVDITRGPLERMLGLSTLVLRTAAATTDCRIPGIAASHADELRRYLLARAGVDDAV